MRHIGQIAQRIVQEAARKAGMEMPHGSVEAAGGGEAETGPATSPPQARRRRKERRGAGLEEEIPLARSSGCREEEGSRMVDCLIVPRGPRHCRYGASPSGVVLERREAMKERTRYSVSGQTRPPSRSRSTSRPLFAARIPKRCSPIFSDWRKRSISVRSSAFMARQYTRYCVRCNTRYNVQACFSLACYPERYG